MTGQLISRGPYDGPNGKKVWILFGLVTDEEGQLKGETRFTLAVPPVLTSPLDVSEHTLGDSPSGILQKAIWCV